MTFVYCDEFYQGVLDGAEIIFEEDYGQPLCDAALEH